MLFGRWNFNCCVRILILREVAIICSESLLVFMLLPLHPWFHVFVLDVEGPGHTLVPCGLEAPRACGWGENRAYGRGGFTVK